MSWDFYCYPSTSGSPDIEEIEAILAADEDGSQSSWSLEFRAEIVKALLACNPRLLTSLVPAALEDPGTTTNEAVGSIELYPPDGDLIIQIFVGARQVFFAIPYWYEGIDAQQTFAQLLSYAQILRKQFGFLAYDPQSGEAYDPAGRDSLDHTFYEKTVRSVPSLIKDSVLPRPKKPWWRFW